MVPIHSRITIRRAASVAGLAALLCVIAIGLSQCTLVTDRLTGVSVSSLRSSSSNCIARCQDAAQEARRAESKLHVERVRACDSDPACLAAEAQRHEQAIEGINQTRKGCMNGCHHQGRGSGGD